MFSNLGLPGREPTDLDCRTSLFQGGRSGNHVVTRILRVQRLDNGDAGFTVSMDFHGLS